MISTRLILIEGPPGSGKTTTAQRVAQSVSQTGRPCQVFHEWSPDHPIAIGDDLHLGQVIATAREREPGMQAQWQQFARQREKKDLVTVLESRFWQTHVMLLYAAGASRQAVIESNRQVVETLMPLEPVLIYYSIDDLRAFTMRTIQAKEVEWQKGGFPGQWAQHIYDAVEPQPWSVERGLKGLEGYLSFLEEWSEIAAELYDRLPFRKITIKNPHLDWSLPVRQIERFLGFV